MDCPHLSDNCKINRDLIRTKKCQLIDGKTAASSSINHHVTLPLEANTIAANATTNLNTVVANQQQHQKLWKCSECASEKNNWLCLHCGSVLCGRFEKGHALNHFKQKSHKVCMNTLDFSVFCYKCDDFVINETRSVEELRQELKNEDDTCSETSSSSKSLQETASVSSNDSGWEDTPKSGRKLRPRKRTNSSESSEILAAKRKSLRKVVGLRNLGNTCFMNSVLQSLSNIREFSCYFNALPCLEPNKNQKQQRVYCSRSLKENMNDANVVEELRKVLINLSKGGDGTKAISPECLFLVIWKVVPQFRGHRQHDAHEFLRYMLDRLHTELQHLSVDPSIIQQYGVMPSTSLSTSGNSSSVNKSQVCGSASAYGNLNSLSGSIKDVCGGVGNIYRGGRSSIVTNVFGGILQSEVRCLICGMESKKHDPFLDLSLDIPEKFYKDCGIVTGSGNANTGTATQTALSAAVTANNNNSNNNSNVNSANHSEKGSSDVKQPVCNINDCLSSFTEIEELADTELYYCNSCKCKQRSTKRFWIRRLPNVLCLHIKRFRWNNSFRTKLDVRITFPITSLDMSQYVLNNGPETRRNSHACNVYDLAAVIVHHGNGSSCGHYTSFAVNNGTWLHFNDHTVKEVPSNVVAECKPYILFYIRRDVSSNSSSSSNSSATNTINSKSS